MPNTTPPPGGHFMLRRSRTISNPTARQKATVSSMSRALMIVWKKRSSAQSSSAIGVLSLVARITYQTLCKTSSAP